MKHFILGDNLGLVVGRQSTDDCWCNIEVSKCIIDDRFHFSYKGISSIFPLYLYPETNAQLSFGESQTRVPNFNMEIVNKIAKELEIDFEPEKNVILEEYYEGLPWYFGPLDLLDYYAVLHSPKYREKYKEFLKIDFPRVPFPMDK